MLLRRDCIETRKHLPCTSRKSRQGEKANYFQSSFQSSHAFRGGAQTTGSSESEVSPLKPVPGDIAHRSCCLCTSVLISPYLIMVQLNLLNTNIGGQEWKVHYSSPIMYVTPTCLFSCVSHKRHCISHHTV